MASKSKPKTQVQKQIQVQKQQVRQEPSNGLLPIETQKKIVIRYGIAIGINILERKKRKETHDITKKKRETKKKLMKLYEDISEGKGDLKSISRKIKELKNEYNKLQEEYKIKAEPFNRIIRPLRINLREIDKQVVSEIEKAGLLKIITKPEDIPPEYRINPNQSSTPNK